MEYRSPESLAVMLFNAALHAVDPYQSVKSYVEKIRNTYHDGNFKKFLVIGFGNASYPMAKAVEDQLGSLVDTGIVITKYGHSGKQGLDKISVYEAGHPVPDGNGLKAANEITKRLKDSDEQTLVVCLISGGGSALLVSPYEGISLADKQEMTKLFLNSGADIYRPSCLISGGETTVTVRGNGLGGRNTELALLFALEIEGVWGITFLSAGTDVTDGPTDAAGAIVHCPTVSQAISRGLNPDEYLKNNDSYTFFKETNGLFITGPTGTNEWMSRLHS